MKDQEKTGNQLTHELSLLRSSVAEMEAALAQAGIVKKRLQLVNSLKENLLRSAGLNEKLKLITDGVVRIFEADFARIWIISSGDRCDSGCIHANVTEGPHVCHYRDRCLHLLASSGRYSHVDGRMHCRVPFDCYKIGRIASGAEPRFVTNDVVNDARVHDQTWAKELGLVSFAGYRILARTDTPIGVLALFSKQLLSRDDDSLLEGIANTAAHVFQTAIIEESLRKSRQDWEDIFQAIGHPSIIMDLQHGVLAANKATIEATGKPLEELLNTKCYEVFHKSGEPPQDCPMVALLKSGSQDPVEMEMEALGRRFLVSCTPVLDKDGGIEKIIHIATDITELKRSEQDLREAEERMRLLIESAPIAIRIATQGRYSYVNPAFLNMFGYGCWEEIEGLPVEALYVEEDKRLITERNANRAKGISVDPHYRVTGIRQDGAHIDLEAWGSEISYQGQRSTLRFLIDVTESNSLRAQLLQSQKMEAVGTLAGGIAHDFNNLLQAVLGYSDFMLQRKKEGERDYADLQKIYKAGKRGADLVKSLMTFSQKIEAQYVPVNLNQEITQVQDLLSRTIPKTIKIDLRLSRDLEPINADPSQIGQVVMNLGVNARDAMPDGGTLTIETANVQLDKEYCSDHLEAIPGGYVLLTVSDTGQGMDKKTVSHIFEPFFTTKEKGKGTGLGLATVYGIIKHHYGHIICYSEPGHGTTFKIYLPAIQIKKDLEVRIVETAIPGGTETILLVDDDDDIRDLAAAILIDFGYKVITAVNGKQALEIYQSESESISLIILDLIMPVMDGAQCLAEILRSDPNAKVIIASGYSESRPTNGVMAAGAKGFVPKPYNMRQFLTMTREILDES